MSKMRPLRALISLQEAKEMILKAVEPIQRTEIVPIDALLGRVAAENLHATIDVPSFDKAAMDGYAVIAEDTFGAGTHNPITLKPIDVIHAGEVAGKTIQNGQCAQIATGAMIPNGADAVIMVEDTETTGDLVQIFKPIYPGGNIFPKGSDVKAGDLIIKKGDLLTARKAGIIAAVGIDRATVYAQPKIAVIPTGYEIAELGADLQPGQVYDINSYTMANLIRENGGIPIRYPVIGDSMDDLRKVVAKAQHYDAIVLSGGSSVGEKDILIDVIEEAGEIYFHGVQIKPGKPTLFGQINGKLIFGMPGYPTSCMINAYVFIVPAIRKMARLPQQPPMVVKAKMAKRVVSSLGRHQFYTVKIEEGIAYPAFKESGTITSMSHADGYIEIPYNVEFVEKGEEVEVILF
ncbi:MAG: gephyrin-like molybdotransferase Glp [Candidatus Heimdallarchaeota archaeon]